MTHTPWILFRFSKLHHWKVDTGNPDWFVDCGFDEEVARKVAATSELLEACERFLESSACQNDCDPGDMTCDTNFARAIVAKATGGK
ncbi:hypothetical protein LCGC14_1306870 [marine sediment metagenome]|uniref:Uncharacterized protein n=1 Tax=marine sediment metagenome TaxID=412755 RepID=A0A0F9N4N2_9ZZZZ